MWSREGWKIIKLSVIIEPSVSNITTCSREFGRLLLRLRWLTFLYLWFPLDFSSAAKSGQLCTWRFIFFSRLCHWLHEKSSFLCIHQALAEIPTLPIQCVASRFPDFYHILPIYHEILKTRKKLLILSIFLQFEFETLLLGITVSYPIMSHRVSPLKTLAVSKYSKCRLRQIKACVCERLRR